MFCPIKGTVFTAEMNFYELQLSESIIVSHTFHTLKNEPIRVEKLTVHGILIKGVEDDAFRGLEDTLKYLDLEFVRTYQAPGNLVRIFPKINYLPNLDTVIMRNLTLTKLHSAALEGLSSLHTLILDDGELTSLSPSDFTSQTSSLKTLSVMNNSLREIPKAALASLQQLTTLKLGNNRLMSLDQTSFDGLSKLKNLDLTNNDFLAVHRDTFSILPNLQSIAVSETVFNRDSDNNLQIVQSFRNLESFKLECVDDIQELPTDMFTSMQNLKSLNLSGCHLPNINQGSFKGLQSRLEKLSLNNNNLTKIEQYTFVGFHQLKSLDLSWNNLHDALNATSFQGLENSLTHLDLTGAELGTNNLEAISHLVNVETLRLDMNRIDSIPDLTFQRLGQLRILNLNHNSLTHLNSQALHGTNSLQEVYLESNQLRSVSHCVFKDFDNLDISLFSNPLVCDCHSRWLQQQLMKRMSVAPGHLQIKYSFLHCGNDRLLKMGTEHFVCEEGEDIEECLELPSLPTITQGMNTATDHVTVVPSVYPDMSTATDNVTVVPSVYPDMNTATDNVTVVPSVYPDMSTATGNTTDVPQITSATGTGLIFNFTCELYVSIELISMSMTFGRNRVTMYSILAIRSLFI